MTLSTLAITTPDGTIDSQLLLPEGDGPFPAILLLTDIRGARPVYTKLAAALAEQGFAVLLPNLYYRSAQAPVVVPDAPFDDETRARLQSYRKLLTLDAQASDFDAFVRTLDATDGVDASRIGVVGYCMTGSFALRLAAQYPDRVRAAASFHGGQLAPADDASAPHLLAPRIKARVHIGHADQDASAPPEQIARLDAALAEAGVDFTTEFYAGRKHGFAIADSAAYDADASARHLRRLLTLFGESLR
ncbi:dienelactone hydrolase family protein [Sphingobium sufflavum]|uniref:dienelactone hydrolase family protein n=1 Tax=Sphingobium sufflavum TaxID=1129547 RepID=UPI001F2B507B|nr:dienelactone hydrolase family protein [Sphingobium sufflavum]MCE7796461.1 dienelactone hydrolase family protein [Sphingobium sufflavum]